MEYLQQIREIRSQIYQIDDQIAELLASNLSENQKCIKWERLAERRASLFDYLLVTENLHGRVKTA
jgi:hypothetical protein